MKIPQATLLSDALQKILWLMRHPKNDLKEGQRPPCWEILASMNTLPRETDLLKTGKVKYYSQKPEQHNLLPATEPAWHPIITSSYLSGMLVGWEDQQV